MDLTARQPSELARPGPHLRCREFAADGQSIRAARRFVGEYLSEHDATSLLDVVSLVVSEMATNSVIHAGSGFRVCVTMNGDTLFASVTDASRRVPIVRDVEPDAVTGRGMMLVANLTDRWGVELSDSGKSVWFEVSRRDG